MKPYLCLFFLLIGCVVNAQQDTSSDQIPATLTKAEKVYGLSKFWQEVNYNFVYLDQVDRELWDSTYVSLIDEVQSTENDYEYYRLLQRFCALLKDGHTNVFFPRNVNEKIYNTYFGDYRLFLTNIDGRAACLPSNIGCKMLFLTSRLQRIISLRTFPPVGFYRPRSELLLS